MRILLFLAVILSATLVLAQGGGVDYKGVAPIVVSGGKVGLSLSSTGGLSLTGTNLSLSTGGTAGQAVIYGQAGSGTIATSGSGTFGTLASSGTNFSTDSAGEFAMIFNFGLWPVFAAFLAIGLPLFIFRKKIPNWIWWLEITAFVTICIGLGIAVVF